MDGVDSRDCGGADMAMTSRRVKRLANAAAKVADKAAAPAIFQFVDANDGGPCDFSGRTPDKCRCSLCWAGRRINRNR